jgi:hypothetical protein
VNPANDLKDLLELALSDGELSPDAAPAAAGPAWRA